MADHQLTCPFCDAQMTVSESQAGMHLACPHCNGEFHLDPPNADDGSNSPLPVPDKLPFFGFSKRKLFGRHLEHLAGDEVLSSADKAHLKQLAAQMGLSEADVNSVQGKLFMERFEEVQKRINSTLYVTDQDLAELEALKKRYSASVEFDESINLARERWLMDEKGALPKPMSEASAILQRGELAYHEVHTTWHQMRSVRKGYVGTSVGLRLAKGVRLSVGRAIPICSEELKPLATGKLIATNKRLLFQGSHRSTSIAVGQITGMELFREGLMIHKSRGLSDLFALPLIQAAYLESLLGRLVGQ